MSGPVGAMGNTEVCVGVSQVCLETLECQVVQVCHCRAGVSGPLGATGNTEVCMGVTQVRQVCLETLECRVVQVRQAVWAPVDR